MRSIHKKPQQEIRDEEELGLIRRWKQLTEITLPGLARAAHWPIHFDHCFKRICLDHAFGDVWYHHLRKPAEKHLTGEPLRRAVHCAEELAREGVPLVQQRDAASLRFRGKAPKRVQRELPLVRSAPACIPSETYPQGAAERKVKHG